MSMQVDFLVDGPTTAPMTVVLAHGAGAGMDTPFMAAGPAAPNRDPGLHETWLAVTAQLGPMVIGGKSLGGAPGSWLMRLTESVRG
jgi:predicted alpha/beta-hydrolase family hydrolase